MQFARLRLSPDPLGSSGLSACADRNLLGCRHADAGRDGLFRKDRWHQRHRHGPCPGAAGPDLRGRALQPPLPRLCLLRRAGGEAAAAARELHLPVSTFERRCRARGIRIRGRIETKRREKTKKSRERKIRSRLFVRRGGEIRTPIGGFGDRSLSPSTTPLFGCCLSAKRSIAQRRGSGNGKIKDRLLGGYYSRGKVPRAAKSRPPCREIATIPQLLSR